MPLVPRLTELPPIWVTQMDTFGVGALNRRATVSTAAEIVAMACASERLGLVVEVDKGALKFSSGRTGTCILKAAIPLGNTREVTADKPLFSLMRAIITTFLPTAPTETATSAATALRPLFSS